MIACCPLQAATAMELSDSIGCPHVQICLAVIGGGIASAVSAGIATHVGVGVRVSSATIASHVAARVATTVAPAIATAVAVATTVSIPVVAVRVTVASIVTAFALGLETSLALSAVASSSSSLEAFAVATTKALSSSSAKTTLATAEAFAAIPLAGVSVACNLISSFPAFATFDTALHRLGGSTLHWRSFGASDVDGAQLPCRLVGVEFKLDVLTRGKGLEAITCNCREMHEVFLTRLFGAVTGEDEAVTLLSVEEFDRSNQA
mmetsp:Transcript_116569/g.324857  ORF Transcript_116569/g.324857 Transcript_116569/m.324857 type:complete len:263 (+) Transcript_116569:142-930(+)